jgi:hypothetical protein
VTAVRVSKSQSKCLEYTNMLLRISTFPFTCLTLSATPFTDTGNKLHVAALWTSDLSIGDVRWLAWSLYTQYPSSHPTTDENKHEQPQCKNAPIVTGHTIIICILYRPQVVHMMSPPNNHSLLELSHLSNILHTGRFVSYFIWGSTGLNKNRMDDKFVHEWTSGHVKI